MKVLRIATSVVIAAAGAVVTLVQLNLPSKQFWTGLSLLQWCCVAIVALYVVYEAAATTNQEIRYSRVAGYDHDLRAVMSLTVALIVKNFPVSWDEIAVCYFGSRKLLWRSRPVFIDGLRAGAPAEIEPHFNSREGFIGQAARGEGTLVRDWREVVESAYAKGKADWDKRGRAERYSMNWGQLQRSYWQLQGDLGDVGQDWEQLQQAWGRLELDCGRLGLDREKLTQDWGQLKKDWEQSPRDHGQLRSFPRPVGMAAYTMFGEDGRHLGYILVRGPLTTDELGERVRKDVIPQVAGSLDRLKAPPSGWWRIHG